jgi:hypothetical protein
MAATNSGVRPEQPASTELVGELMGHLLQRSTQSCQEALMRLRLRQ